MFRKRNRRRADIAKKTGEATAVAKSHGPVVLKVLGLLFALPQFSSPLHWDTSLGYRVR